MRIITDSEAIRYVLQYKGSFVCYLGAGLSADAKVMTAQQICAHIRDELMPKGLTPAQQRRWENERLAWDNPGRRYPACMRAHGNAAQRVQFFRNLLKSARPAFAHHALALLMAHGYFKRTCITTNFDKLLEGAFTRHALMECQPVRHEDEVEYLGKEQDKCYVLKLHGDYDTYNILNTETEVLSFSEEMVESVRGAVSGAGLMVLGTAGYEESVRTLFNQLTSKPEQTRKVFPSGLLWGVYVPGPKPEGHLTQKQLEKIVRQQLDAGSVSPSVVEMMNRVEPWDDNFCFFPVWGAGNFMLDLVKETGDTSLRVTAEAYLDHEMRLRQVFERANLSGATISKHIASLTKEQRQLKEKAKTSPAEHETVAVAASRAGPLEVHLVYGDITKRAWMGSEPFSRDVRAVVSPEDTCVSAGGGVAYLLLDKAGPPFILNELAKFAPVPRTTVAVTSGGALPAHYIFHAAAIEIGEGPAGDVKYFVSPQDVLDTTANILKKGAALGVGALWVPLMGAGVASQKGEFGPQQSLESILEAVAAWAGPAHPMKVMIVIYADKVLTRDKARATLHEKLDPGFSIQTVE